MNIDRLQELKRKLTNDADLSDIWLFYMDHFADHPECKRVQIPTVYTVSTIGWGLNPQPIVILNSEFCLLTSSIVWDFSPNQPQMPMECFNSIRHTIFTPDFLTQLLCFLPHHLIAQYDFNRCC